MFKKSIDEFKADIKTWADREQQLLARQRDAAARISAAELAAGAALLDAADGESTSAPVDAVVRARSELSTIQAAIRACRTRRSDAIRAKRQAEADELRKQATEIQGQVEIIDAKVAKHLSAVDELQESKFGTVLLRGGGIPLTQRLRTQISALEQQAAALERDVPNSGTVDISDATNTEALIAAVLRHEADVPDTQSIIEWAAACERKSTTPFGDHPRRFYLVWRDGVIDASESYVQVGALARISPGPNYGTLAFNLGSDQFRAAAPSVGFGV